MRSRRMRFSKLRSITQEHKNLTGIPVRHDVSRGAAIRHPIRLIFAVHRRSDPSKIPVDYYKKQVYLLLLYLVARQQYK
jgi:hypothetical protein